MGVTEALRLKPLPNDAPALVQAFGETVPRVGHQASTHRKDPADRRRKPVDLHASKSVEPSER